MRTIPDCISRNPSIKKNRKCEHNKPHPSTQNIHFLLPHHILPSNSKDQNKSHHHFMRQYDLLPGLNQPSFLPFPLSSPLLKPITYTLIRSHISTQLPPLNTPSPKPLHKLFTIPPSQPILPHHSPISLQPTLPQYIHNLTGLHLNVAPQSPISRFP